MTESEKLNFLKDAIKALKNQDVDQLNRAIYLSDLKIDSLDAVELQMYYEEKTGVETSDPNKPVKTVGDLIDLMP